MRSALAWLSGIALIVAACGSGGGGAVTPTPAVTATSTGAAVTPAPAGTPASTPASTPAPTAAPSTGGGIGGPGDFEAGAIRYRVANVSSEPVDVYARTQGVVQAFLMQEGLAPGAVTDYFAPPDPGTLVVTTAGAGDPTCVASCPHFIGSWSTTSASGDQLTVIISDEGGSDVWEHPRAEDIGTFANALPDGDPDRSTFFVAAKAVTGADFGLRLAIAGTPGCQVDAGDSGLLVGGTSILPFEHDGSAGVTIHENTDRECATPVGGPFAVDGSAGTRALLVLSGAPGSMEALVLPIE